MSPAARYYRLVDVESSGRRTEVDELVMDFSCRKTEP